jgi:hypothetical protein
MATKARPAPKCISCRTRKSVSADEEGVPPLCNACWDRQGLPVKKGDRVICVVTDSCSGTVEAVHDGNIAQITTNDGKEAWIPFASLVKAAKQCSDEAGLPPRPRVWQGLSCWRFPWPTGVRADATWANVGDPTGRFSESAPNDLDVWEFPRLDGTQETGRACVRQPYRPWKAWLPCVLRSITRIEPATTR